MSFCLVISASLTGFCLTVIAVLFTGRGSAPTLPSTRLNYDSAVEEGSAYSLTESVIYTICKLCYSAVHCCRSKSPLGPLDPFRRPPAPSQCACCLVSSFRSVQSVRLPALFSELMMICGCVTSVSGEVSLRGLVPTGDLLHTPHRRLQPGLK